MKLHFQKIFILTFIFLAFWGCENERTPVEPGSESSSLQLHKDGFTAELFLYIHKNDPSVNVRVHMITEAWVEEKVSWLHTDKIAGSLWTNPGGTFTDVSSVIPTFIPDLKYSYLPGIDITEIVEKWMEGEPNHGILLEQGSDGVFVVYSSRTGEYPPYVVLTYPDGAQITIPISSDSYIWENNPTITGNDQYLYTGLVNGNKKHTLLKFDVPIDDGCTYTPGYWKTHSKYGPAPYDSIWNDKEDTPFFLSGQTYYEVLWTSPKSGNVYYILAHAFIAAELNKLNGANFTDAASAFEDAAYLFNNYTVDYAAGLKGKGNREERAYWIDLAEILDNYNNGLIGPGHCE